ncbi:hypothetical protein ABTO49_20905, partial [Acinetobacter baumannii]
ANVKAQGLNSRINVSVGNENLSAVIKKLEIKSNLVFAYDEAYLGLKNIYVKPASFTNEPLETVLTGILRYSGIGFKEEAGNILLFKQGS